MAPVVGSRATADPPKPEAPGVLAIAELSSSVARRCTFASTVRVTLAPCCVMPRSWSMIEENSFWLPTRASFSERSIPVCPAWMKL